MIRRRSLSIRFLLRALGGLGIAVAVGLAGSGLLATQRQLEARARIVFFQQAASSHSTANEAINDIRAVVMRALISGFSSGNSLEGTIEAELKRDVGILNGATAENRGRQLGPDLRESSQRIDDLVAPFVRAGEVAVALAATDPVAASRRFDDLERRFRTLEPEMDGMAVILNALVQKQRKDAAATAEFFGRTTFASLIGGVSLLALITFLSERLAQRIGDDLASSREEAHRLALHDPLTRLPNRACHTERLDQALEAVQRGDGMLAMHCLDLDRFKLVNDTLGHAVGDALLRAVGDRLHQSVRKHDTVARLGGDEFAIIQTGIDDVGEAAALAQRVVAALSLPYQLDGHQVMVGVSIGIAFAPQDASEGGHLMKMADLALYRAKADGRGVFRLFQSDMDLNLQTRRKLEIDLRQAVAMDELELHYQPLVDLASGKVNAVEALVRWRHPERGLVSPDSFVPLAEETGLIKQIGNWVLHRACADAAQWPDAIQVAVNISASQFKGPGLVTAVAEALERAKLPASRLELEITETALLSDSEATISVLRELRAMGVRIAMDDFGTGYSSLGYIRSFPFDKIKIDRSFITDIEASSDCKAIVRAVTGLSHNLGMVTTAEGVETIGQLAHLRAEGCQQVQGYLFSRPVPARDIPALLIKRLGESEAVGCEKEPVPALSV